MLIITPFAHTHAPPPPTTSIQGPILFIYIVSVRAIICDEHHSPFFSSPDFFTFSATVVAAAAVALVAVAAVAVAAAAAAFPTDAFAPLIAASMVDSFDFRKSLRKLSYRNFAPLVWGIIAHRRKAILNA